MIKGINNTLQITIPMPVSPVPKNRTNDPPKTLTTVPIKIKTIPNIIAWELPNTFPILAEKSEKVANVNKGNVVRKPAHPLLSCRSSLIKGINGPIAVMEGLRLKETNRIPKKRNQLVWYKGFSAGMNSLVG